jgi:hypothetical protein
VVIPVNESIDLILTMITSKIESVTNYYSGNPGAFASLVSLDGKELSFLNRSSLIDCNNIELIAKADLLKKIDPSYGFELKTSTVPDELKQRIIRAITHSPVVKPIIKKLLHSKDIC